MREPAVRRRLAPRILAASIALCAIGSACGGGVAVYPLAVGARGTLPTWNGPCDATGMRGDAVTIEDSRYVAVHEGDVVLACRDGSVRLEVRPITALSIDGPTALDGDWTEYRLTASSGSRELDLGDADVEWTLSDSLERDSGCHGHLIASCDAASVIRIRRRTNGEATLSAALGERRATRTLDAR